MTHILVYESQTITPVGMSMICNSIIVHSYKSPLSVERRINLLELKFCLDPSLKLCNSLLEF